MAACKDSAIQLRVGIFVAVGLILAMTVIFMVGSQGKLFERYYTVYANFDSIAGLRIGAPVQLAGLKVGFVDKINFSRDLEAQQITVALKIQKRFQDRIRGDSMATIETQGLLGDKYVYVSMGSEVQPVIPDKGIITSKETTSIFSLAEKAGSIMDDIAGASKTLSDLLGTVKDKKGEGDLKASMSSIRKTLEQVEKGKGFMHALIYDPQGEKVISSLADTINSIKDISEGAEKDSKGNVNSLIVNLRRSSADLNDILGAIKRGEGTLGKLVKDPALYDDLNALVGRANRNTLLRSVVRSTIRENDKQLLK